MNGFSVEPAWRGARSIHFTAADNRPEDQHRRYLATGIVDHHDRCIVSVATAELLQMLGDGVARRSCRSRSMLLCLAGAGSRRARCGVISP